jgi:signal transduction histidine kinase/ligand-binding sensor domain-containing protein/CheY-like chemotaxis protein
VYKILFLLIAIIFPPAKASEELNARPLLAEPKFQLLQIKETQVAVNKVFQDKKGFLWFGTNQGLLRYDGYKVRKFLAGNEKHDLSNNIIWDIVDDKMGNLWISTYGGGLNKYDPKKDNFTRFKKKNELDSLSTNALWDIEKLNDEYLWLGSRNWLNKFNIENNLNQRLSPDSNPALKINNNVWSLLQDSKQNLWIGTLGEGLYYYNTSNGLQAHFNYNEKNNNSLSNNSVRSIVEDTSGDIWIGTDNGLNLLNVKNNKFTRFFHLPNNNESLSGNEINKIFKDSKNRIWIGTYGKGLNLYNKTNNNFIRYDFRSLGLDKSRMPKIVYDIFEDRQGILWFATEKGLLFLPPTALAFKKVLLNDNHNSAVNALHYSNNSGLSVAFGGEFMNLSTNSLKFTPKISISDNISDIAEDSSGNFWLATANSGLYKISSSGDLLTHFQKDSTHNTLPSNNIYSIHLEKENRLWVGLYRKNDAGGLLLIEKNKGVTQHFFQDKSIFDIEQLDEKTLLLATNKSGIIRFNLDTFQSTFITGLEEQNLNFILDIYISPSKKIFVGTEGGGLAELLIHSNEIKPILPSLISVKSILEDKSNNLWLSTENTLIKYNQKTKVVSTFEQSDGLPISLFSNRTIILNNDNLVFGSSSGLLVFTPESLKYNSTNNPIQLVELKLFNHPVTVSTPDKKTLLNKSLHFSKELTLSYEDYLFSLSFSALDFYSPETITYKYILEGFGDRWIDTNANNRIATFSNIPAGTYTFRVKAVDKQGLELNSEASIIINILPPWWKTNYAYTTYIVVVLLLIYFIIHIRTRKLKKYTLALELGIKNRTVELEEKTNVITEILEQKKRMYTHISHEFRTPLTLIIIPVNKLLKQHKNEEEMPTLLSLKRNSQRLLQLVEQLLGLAKLESPIERKKHLYSFKQILPLIITNYEPLAKLKKQSFQLNNIAYAVLEMLPESLEIIIGNLLSNAIKYSPEGTTIEITSVNRQGVIDISVKDTGVGISPEYQQVIFERFHRGVYESNEKIPGAGIGLALVKELVALHQGEINLQSHLGVGSQFQVSLPIYLNNYNKQDLVTSIEFPKFSVVSDYLPNEPLKDEYTLVKNNLPILLIVEDNFEMRKLLIEIFSTEYDCIQASNGIEAMDIASIQVPDVIICDVMMPNMNGYEFSKAIKQNEVLSHIPIMLLTARADLESRKEGWRQHVDDYLTKPFDADELQLRLNNLLVIRGILRKRFVSEMKNNPLGLIQIKEELNIKDQSFLEKLEYFIEEGYSDTEFQLPQIAKKLFMGERQLQRKLKAIMDLTFSEYLRSFRLKKAAKLLQEGLPNNLIIEKVGFSSPSYFSSCFKAEYNETPKQFQQRVTSIQRRNNISEENLPPC